jgi:hypothetical protein
LWSTELNELKELAAFAGYKGELGGGPEKNNGEAAVLAWVSVNGGTAIIDEEVGRNMGVRDGLQVHGSLWPAAHNRGFCAETGHHLLVAECEFVEDFPVEQLLPLQFG